MREIFSIASTGPSTLATGHSIFMLPDDILVAILSMCSSQDLCKFTRVSKFCRQFVHTFVGIRMPAGPVEPLGYDGRSLLYLYMQNLTRTTDELTRTGLIRQMIEWWPLHDVARMLTEHGAGAFAQTLTARKQCCVKIASDQIATHTVKYDVCANAVHFIMDNYGITISAAPQIQPSRPSFAGSGKLPQGKPRQVRPQYADLCTKYTTAKQAVEAILGTYSKPKPAVLCELSRLCSDKSLAPRDVKILKCVNAAHQFLLESKSAELAAITLAKTQTLRDLAKPSESHLYWWFVLEIQLRSNPGGFGIGEYTELLRKLL